MVCCKLFENNLLPDSLYTLLTLILCVFFLFCSGGAIGRATGIIFAREGAAGVAFADINLETARSAADESRKHATNPQYKAISVRVDVADEASVDAMVRDTVAAFGALNYAVNSAGVSFEAVDKVCKNINENKCVLLAIYIGFS